MGRFKPPSILARLFALTDRPFAFPLNHLKTFLRFYLCTTSLLARPSSQYPVYRPPIHIKGSNTRPFFSVTREKVSGGPLDMDNRKISEAVMPEIKAKNHIEYILNTIGDSTDKKTRNDIKYNRISLYMHPFIENKKFESLITFAYGDAENLELAHSNESTRQREFYDIYRPQNYDPALHDIETNLLPSVINAMDLESSFPHARPISFSDLGSSTGRIVIAARLLGGCENCVGVELSPSRTTAAIEAAKRISHYDRSLLNKIMSLDVRENLRILSSSSDSVVDSKSLSSENTVNADMARSADRMRSDIQTSDIIMNLGLTFTCGDIFDPENIPLVDVYFVAIGRKGRKVLIPKLLNAIKEAHCRKLKSPPISAASISDPTATSELSEIVAKCDGDKARCLVSKHKCRIICCGFTLPRLPGVRLLHGITFPTPENMFMKESYGASYPPSQSVSNRTSIGLSAKSSDCDSITPETEELKIEPTGHLEKDTESVTTSGDNCASHEEREKRKIVDRHDKFEKKARRERNPEEERVGELSKYYFPLYGGRMGPRVIFSFDYEFEVV